MRRLGQVAGCGLAAGITLAPAASAHDWLTTSNPAAGATVTSAPTDIRLTFNDRVLTKPAEPAVVVTGPDGRHYETGCASALDRDVSVAWKPGAPGRYRVEWRIVSADGHPVSDAMTFTYAGHSGGNAGRSTSPACEKQTEAGSGRSGADRAPVYVAGGAVALAAVALVAMVSRSRRR